MKKLITLALVLMATAAFAGGTLERDGSNSAIIQGYAPDGLKSQILTVNSTTIDMTNDLYWSLYSTTACKFRQMPTSAKGAYPQFTVPASERIGFVVHKNTKFVNYSGCTSGELNRQ